MTEQLDRYAEACQQAATDQGLDPLTEAVAARRAELDARGVTYGVEQTGGFTMVATFYVGTEAVTCTNEDTWIVVAQPMMQWLSSEYDEDAITDLLRPGLTPNDIIDAVLVRATFAPGTRVRTHIAAPHPAAFVGTVMAVSETKALVRADDGRERVYTLESLTTS